MKITKVVKLSADKPKSRSNIPKNPYTITEEETEREILESIKPVKKTTPPKEIESIQEVSNEVIDNIEIANEVVDEIEDQIVTRPEVDDSGNVIWDVPITTKVEIFDPSLSY